MAGRKGARGRKKFKGRKWEFFVGNTLAVARNLQQTSAERTSAVRGTQ